MTFVEDEDGKAHLKQALGCTELALQYCDVVAGDDRDTSTVRRVRQVEGQAPVTGDDYQHLMLALGDVDKGLKAGLRRPTQTGLVRVVLSRGRGVAWVHPSVAEQEAVRALVDGEQRQAEQDEAGAEESKRGAVEDEDEFVGAAAGHSDSHPR